MDLASQNSASAQASADKLHSITVIFNNAYDFVADFARNAYDSAGSFADSTSDMVTAHPQAAIALGAGALALGTAYLWREKLKNTWVNKFCAKNMGTAVVDSAAFHPHPRVIY